MALTGTPGTGKSAVGRVLRKELSVVEVGDLARRLGLGRRTGRGVVVDLANLRRRFPRLHAAHPHQVYVGHLAHLLPISDVVVLRCDPRLLGQRLRRARRGSARDRAANVVAEAIDLVLQEALRPGRRVWEVDTTGRTPAQVAREVGRRIRHGGRSQYGRVRWLTDPRVTDYLLERSP